MREHPHGQPRPDGSIPGLGSPEQTQCRVRSWTRPPGPPTRRKARAGASPGDWDQMLRAGPEGRADTPRPTAQGRQPLTQSPKRTICAQHRPASPTNRRRNSPRNSTPRPAAQSGPLTTNPWIGSGDAGPFDPTAPTGRWDTRASLTKPCAQPQGERTVPPTATPQAEAGNFLGAVPTEGPRSQCGRPAKGAARERNKRHQNWKSSKMVSI